MKILHVIGAFDKKLGGTYSAILSIIRIENILGYQNEVMSLVSAGQEYDHDFKGKLHLFEPSFPYLFNTSGAAAQWFNKHVLDYDLVLIHEVWGATAMMAAWTAHRNGVRYVIWPHGSLDPFDIQKKKWLKMAIGKMLVGTITNRASAICCTSQLESDLLVTFKQHKTNVSILPLPINYGIKGSRSVFRRFHRIADDDLVFLFLSRVDYKKGLDLFLHAYRKFLNATGIRNTKLLIAGRGKPAYEQYIKKLVLELNLSNQVIISGFLTGSLKADAYAGSDCFVLPSMNENYGISVIEALQCGLPVLISDNVYIHKEIIPDGGWLSKYDTDSIYEQLMEVYEDFKHHKLLDKRATATGNKFNQQSLLPVYADFYKRITYEELEFVAEPKLVG